MIDSPETQEPTGDELLPEYDFRAMRGVVRGKFAERSQIVKSAKDEATSAADESMGS